jgi:UDP-N-acetylmuramoyl-tripeptide--D-alanyl-D-alanine ligase
MSAMQGFLSLYSWRYPLRLVRLWRQHGHSLTAYLKIYWHTNNFSHIGTRQDGQLGPRELLLAKILYVGAALQVTAGLTLIGLWYLNDLTGGWQFGLAVVLAYPLLWAHLLVVIVWLWWLAHPKALGRAIICNLLESQVRRLRQKNNFSVVAVAGSVGKTSTKIAIARVLQVSRRVLWQEGNYNDRVTVPLIFFDRTQPGIFNVFAWLKILVQNENTLRNPYPYQVVVVELGTDGPGYIREFAYIKPELAIVTAVTAEHMEYFGSLDAVAREELTVLNFSRQALINIDDTPLEYLVERNYLPYSLGGGTTYHTAKRKAKGLHGQMVTFQLGEKDSFELTIPLLGEQGAKTALAAAAAAHALGLPLEDIQKGVAEVSAFSGRMQVLHGIKDSTIIDDTYNSSPVAAKAALDVLQGGEAPQRIAIMGSMNELGAHSAEAHREVGEHCDPGKLDWVITIGPDAKEHLAPIAEKRGCQVKAFMDPYKAGRFVKSQLKEGAVVLAKGSQNRVFAEEALKVLLADRRDEAKLVRQSDHWMAVKRKQFKS